MLLDVLGWAYRLLTQPGSERGSLDRDWVPSSLFSIPEAELLVTCPAHVSWLEDLNAVWLLWPEPLGCPSRPPASVCPPRLTFTVGNAPLTVETVERGGCISHSSCVVPCVSAVLPCT